MWREVEHACVIGRKFDAYSVEKHGVRVVFRLGVANPPLEPTGGEGTTRAESPRAEPASAPATNEPKKLNSEQRRSARRREAFILAKWSGRERNTSKNTTEPQVPASGAQVDIDMREIGAAPAESPKEQRGQKRTAVEAIANAKPTPKAAAAEQPEQARPQAQVTKGRAGPGLRPISGPRLVQTCRACGGSPDGEPLGKLRIRRWCHCEVPKWYQRQLYPADGGRGYKGPQRSSNPTH